MQTVKKLVFAFLFQEGTFDSDLLTSPTANSLGASLQSSVNFKVGLPTSLPNLGGNLGHGVGSAAQQSTVTCPHFSGVQVYILETCGAGLGSTSLLGIRMHLTGLINLGQKNDLL